MNEPVRYTAKGYGVEPCPTCGKSLQPDEIRVVVPGEWRPRHETCHDLEELL